MMRRFVIGTAGHVDHGKTTLVRALTGIDTDRLPEEKARGISIELGFAPLDLGDGVRASVVDVPGHRKLVRAMIAGASGMELVMLVVAADEGVMPQTREHVAVCELLGIARAVVVVTKSDAVEADLVQVAAEEARALLGAKWHADVVTCSAKTGEGLDRLKATLRGALLALPAPARSEAARLGVDRVFSVKGAGTVVTGTLVSGRVAVSDRLFLVGTRGPRETAARGLHVHDAAVPSMEAPTRLALNLAGVALEDVRRGDVVTSDAHLRATTLVDVLVRGEHRLKRGAAVTAHVGTASSAARVDAVHASEAGVVARVRLAQATPLAGGDRIVLRGGVSGPSGAVVGGGLVVDASPDPRASGAKRRSLAASLATLDAASTIRSVVEASAPRPLARAALQARFAVDAAMLAKAADEAVRAGTLARVGDHGWVARAELDALVTQARQLVRAHHESAPLERGMPLETLRTRLGARAGRLVAEEAIRRATAGGETSHRLVVEGDVVRAPGSESAAAAAALSRTQAIARAVDEAGAAGATEFTLAQRAGVAAAELRPALQKLAREGAAVRLGELWLSANVVTEAKRRALDHFARARTLTVIEFKELSGLSRKQAILVLEHFDHLGLTRREGDARVLR
ncbi:MAG TPA: selenocysteine-specific translation elongation factor [Polyangiaceae bacterium]